MTLKELRTPGSIFTSVSLSARLNKLEYRSKGAQPSPASHTPPPAAAIQGFYLPQVIFYPTAVIGSGHLAFPGGLEGSYRRVPCLS